jgi:polyphosphate kinase
MHRNLDRRVEALVRVTDPVAQAELTGVLDMSMSQDITAFELSPDGEWRRGDAGADRPPQHLQTALLRRIVDRAD